MATRTPRFLILAIGIASLFTALTVSLEAQERPIGTIQKNGVPAVVPKPKPGMSPTGLPASTGKLTSRGPGLSGNFLLTLTVKEADRQVGEVIVLTSSSMVKTEVNLDASSTPGSVSFEGTLNEQEGGFFVWEYVLGFTVPITTGTSGTAGSQLRTTVVEYHAYSSQGSVQILLGRSYDLLKSGGRTYSITITPATDP